MGPDLSTPRSRVLFLVTVLFFVATTAIRADDAHRLPKDTVTAQSTTPRDMLKVADEEKVYGWADDINDLLFMESGMNRVPESGSLLLSRGGSPYDNQYIVSGVPMFSASHFGGHIFADISGIAVTTVDRITLANSRLGGRYVDATGAVVEFEPGLYRPGKKRWKPRPEIGINAGTFIHDVSLSLPVAGGKQFYQITLNHARDYVAQWLNGNIEQWEDPSLFGYAPAASFADAFLQGRQAIGKVDLRQNVWIAGDFYSESVHSEGEMIPWGMGSVSARWDGERARWKVVVGGSQQPYFEGKRLGSVVPVKKVERTNATVLVETNGLQMGHGDLNASVRIEGVQWEGATVAREYTIDTLAVFASQCDSAGGVTWCKEPEILWKVGRGGVTSRYEKDGEHLDALFHLGWGTTIRAARIEVNALAAALLPAGKVFVDPGAALKLVWPSLTLDIAAGIQSARPDIRGLPGERYAETIGKTYRATGGLRWRPLEKLNVVAEPYAKCVNKCPAISQQIGELWWDPNLETPMVSRGVDLEVQADPFPVLAVVVGQSFAKSERVGEETRQPYEWDVPWASKLVLNLHNTSRMASFYLTGILSAGLPYRELVVVDGQAMWDSQLSRMPVYKRIDARLQLEQDTEGDRFVTRFGLYLDCPNILDFFDGMQQLPDWLWQNTREYYWDEYLKKHPIQLQPYSFSIGLRLGFRL